MDSGYSVLETLLRCGVAAYAIHAAWKLNEADKKGWGWFLFVAVLAVSGRVSVS